MGLHYSWRDGDLVLNCHIQPRASRNEFSALHGDRLKIRLAAPPVEGQANARLLAFLADAFGVARARVTLLKGHASRAKTVLVEAPATLPVQAQSAPATKGRRPD